MTTPAAPLRVGVERGMTTTLAVVALMLVVLALPGFTADHTPIPSPFVLLSLFLATVSVAAVFLSLARSVEPSRACLWVSVAAYVALLALEPFELRDPLPVGSTPWLLALSLPAFGATALAEHRPVRAGLVCAGLDVALGLVYAGRIPVGHSIIDTIGIGLLALSLIAGVRALRSRATRADSAEREAQLLFENRHRQTAIEAERVHTDALLHDNVLATLLAAADHEASDRAASMARTALDLISNTDDHPVMQPSSVRLGQALDVAEAELHLFRSDARLDLGRAHDVELPPDVAAALVSATVQALSNSVEHAPTATRRAAVAIGLGGGGVRISITDDGAGFDPSDIARERLGVRVSILERVRLAGGRAEIWSSPGKGTTVLLEWRPTGSEPAASPRLALPRINLVPRRQLSRVLSALVVMGILTAVSEAALFSRAVGPLIAAVLALSILPALLRGARTGTMRHRTAWAIAAVGLVLCCTATIGLDPNTVDCVSIYWYTCGLLAGAVMVWMTGHRVAPLVTVSIQATQITLWAGPTGTIRLGLAVEIVLVIAGLMMHRAIRRISAAADVAATRQRDLTAQQTELDAFHSERQQRLSRAAATAAPMLSRIIACHGRLDAACRAECRVLEQALRDEIRGRSLLNEAVRSVVSTHRRRGASVQVLDDGGLDTLPPEALDTLLDDVARRLEPLLSSRIVIRTGQPESATAVTIVASTPDETAAALGLDGDDEVDLWVSIPRPVEVTLAA